MCNYKEMNTIKIGGNYVKLLLIDGAWVVGGSKHYTSEIEAVRDNYNVSAPVLILRRVRQLRRSGRVAVVNYAIMPREYISQLAKEAGYNIHSMPLKAWQGVNITWRRPVVKKDDGRALADNYGAGSFFGNTDRALNVEMLPSMFD